MGAGSSSLDKVLWIVVAVLFSALVAVVAGIVVCATGATKPEAVLKGGSTFAASMLLCLAVLTALGAF
ncbi:hypothetical protein [Streptomyces sp. NBC_01190]|uniref:hypothetical protein n=1 Tax=Streptomyces sp. NBC_01190 TaxID=2903767 RepID=UPI00386D6A2A|nr:hypothetical protein OG519_24705 [Streptomyces sp. NBC_01190]